MLPCLSAVVTSWPVRPCFPSALLHPFSPLFCSLSTLSPFSSGSVVRVIPLPPIRARRARDAAPSFSCLLLCKLLSAPAVPRPPFPSPPLPPRPGWRSGNSLPPFSARFRLIAHSSSRGPSHIPSPLPPSLPSLLPRPSSAHPKSRLLADERGSAPPVSLLRGRTVIFAGRRPNHMNP